MVDYRLSPDGVQSRLATREELAHLQHAEARLTQLRAPLLLETPRDRVFVVAMDGTGNNIYKDPPERRTLVGWFKKDVEALRHPAIAVGYTPGIGTQEDYLARLSDGAFALTYQRRIEQAYLEFCVRSARWISEDPNVRIHLVGIGFSRGAELVPALQRMVHERGIRDPSGADVAYDSEGLLRSIRYADHPPLVPPGQTLQVALLHDPVATSLKSKARELPPSTVGALGFTALHESRGTFDATRHLPDGLSERGHIANFSVPGAHADVGGGYLVDGMGRRIYNMDIDYANALFGRPLLQKVAVPYDPRMYVVHSSDQHQYGIFSTDYYRESGQRRIHADLAPGCNATQQPCTRKPVDHDLAATAQWRYVERGLAPGGTDPKMQAALAAIDTMHAREPSLLDRAAAASTVPMRAEVLVAKDRVGELFGDFVESAKRNSVQGMLRAVQAYSETPSGQMFNATLRFANSLGSGPESPHPHRNLGLGRDAGHVPAQYRVQHAAGQPPSAPSMPHP